jgi:DNA primase
MTLTPAWLDELRSRTLLSALVGKSLKITKAGREFKGCCPFHNEKTPSFYVNDEKGFYHCFGCSAHGDAIRWMTDQRGLGFMDAVKELADAAGMEVPAADPHAAERAERANSLYDVMTAAADWFVEQLGGIEGAEARAYLEKRGLSHAIIKNFGMGFAPDARGKLKAALARFGEDKLVESGLLIQVEEKDSYDRFRGRLMIPIRDARGRVIAFGGRILGAGEPKYLNSPDTPLFDKGRTLYNLDLAGPESRKSNRIIVVEGYMDVIALAQVGIVDAVAPLGTALTEHQLERLWRMTDAPLLCFDGDSAGQKAGIRAIGRAMPHLAPSKSLQFITLPAGQDPDDLVRAGGRAAFDALAQTSTPLVDRLWLYELNAEPLATPEARAGLKRRLQDHTQAIQDGDVRGQYAQEFRNRFDAQFHAQPTRQYGGQYGGQFGGQTRGNRGQKWKPNFEPAPSGRAQSISGSGVEPYLSRAILAGLIRHPEVLQSCSEPLSALTMAANDHEALKIEMIDAADREAVLDSAAIIAICDSAGFGVLVADLRHANGLAFSFAKPQSDPEVAKRDLALAIEALVVRPELDAAIAAATARLSRDWNDAGLAEQHRLISARAEADRKLASLAAGEEEDTE